MNIRAKQLIEKAGGNLVGIVLNNITMSQDEGYYYYLFAQRRRSWKPPRKTPRKTLTRSVSNKSIDSAADFTRITVNETFLESVALQMAGFRVIAGGICFQRMFIVIR